jgi:FAD/FMN-containing dehydrogenase
MATLGGLFCGGFGGIGSITYGPLSAPGTVLGIKIMTAEAEPRILELRSPEAMQHAHAHGTNAIILELEIALAPAHESHEYLITFRDAETAFDCGQAVAQVPGMIKRETAVVAASVAAYFKKLSPYIAIEAGICHTSLGQAMRFHHQPAPDNATMMMDATSLMRVPNSKPIQALTPTAVER